MTGDVLAAMGVLVGIVFYRHQDTKADVRELRSLLNSILQSGVKLEVAVKDVVQAAFDEGKVETSTEVGKGERAPGARQMFGKCPLTGDSELCSP